MKKEQALQKILSGKPIYVIATAYCHAKIIAQEILLLNAVTDRSDFDKQIKDFKNNFKAKVKPPLPADKLLGTFHSFGLIANTRSYSYKYLDSLPVSCGVIDAPEAQTGT